MTVTVRFFALVRERAGAAELSLRLEPGATVTAAAEAIAQAIPTVRDLLPRAAFAVNRSYAAGDTILNHGDELAVIPPVSGG